MSSRQLQVQRSRYAGPRGIRPRAAASRPLRALRARNALKTEGCHLMHYSPVGDVRSAWPFQVHYRCLMYSIFVRLVPGFAVCLVVGILYV